jgi:spore germination cell wall hydrolase CwlJ-like protein
VGSQRKEKDMKALLAAVIFLLTLFSTHTMAADVPSLVEISNAATAPKNSSKSDIYWMAMNIYYEAGSEPLIGKIAVGAVTLNRLHDSRFPKNIRDVVTEPQQFSWYNSKIANTPPSNNKRWKECYEVAKMLLTKTVGNDIIKLLEGATHFHAIDIKPSWAARKTKIATIEGHVFYRMN